MFGGMCGEGFEEGFTIQSDQPVIPNLSDEGLTSSPRSATPERTTVPRMLPIPNRSISRLPCSLPTTHLCNMVHLERRLALHVKVSVPLEFVVFTDQDLWVSGMSGVG